MCKHYFTRCIFTVETLGADEACNDYLLPVVEWQFGYRAFYTKVKNVTADLTVAKKYGRSAIGKYHLRLDDMDKVTSILNDFMGGCIERLYGVSVGLQ